MYLKRRIIAFILTDKKVFDRRGNITADSLSSYVHRKIVSLPKRNRPNQTPVRKIVSSGDITIIDKSQLAKLTELGNTVTRKTERMRSSQAIIRDELEEYSQRQLRYVDEIAKQRISEDTKSFLFLEFIRDVFKDVNANQPHRIYPELEKVISSNTTVLIRGRVDAFLGNIIIEFESDLTRYRSNCESQLRKYTAILWNNKEKINYLCIATDGLQFVIFRPRSQLTKDYTEDSIELEIVDTFDIRVENTRTVYKRLDRYFLYRTLTPPTADDIVQGFGYKSLILRDSMFLLEKAWKNVKNESMTVYKEWSKYLSIVYGSDIQNEQLFLRHTYLATLAKLMVFSFYQENTIPTSHDVINRILVGDVIREWNIENFLIEDFFSWIIRSDAFAHGMQISLMILEGLERYDLTRLNEDVLKELYQQLIDPAERHYLGEFYTPDWLAEMMIKETVTDVSCRLLDPACGSGTFLASAIRHKLSLMTELKDSDKINCIIHTVNGIDVHPLAVLISKANYLMSMGDIIKQKKGTLIIPVYMADSIVFPIPTPSVARYNSNLPLQLYHYRIDAQDELVLPRGLVEAETADSILDDIKQFADRKLKDPATSDRGFLTLLEKR
jgi:type I restriction-modification system DNA methylase subunit